MEWQRDLKDPTEFIETVKIDLFEEEVFVFTPKGDVKALPKGATPIDFAYAVHSQVGERCSGARVNGIIVPLRYPLRNGDTVDILTAPTQRPSKDWLKFVVTSRAKTGSGTSCRPSNASGASGWGATSWPRSCAGATSRCRRPRRRAFWRRPPPTCGRRPRTTSWSWSVTGR
jgi:(p)ppGpp synthase/HD superfamily hydrolase